MRYAWGMSKLRIVRESRGQSLAEAGRQVGVSAMAFWRWETGVVPHRKYLPALLQWAAGEVTIADLYHGIEQPSPEPDAAA